MLTITNQVTNKNSKERCCKGFPGEKILTCQDAEVNPDLFKTKEDIRLPDGFVLSFKNPVGSSFTYWNPNEFGEMVISFNKKTGSMFGTFHAYDANKVFRVQRCSNGHVWKELKLTVDEYEGGDCDYPA